MYPFVIFFIRFGTEFWSTTMFNTWLFHFLYLTHAFTQIIVKAYVL